ncbi:phenylalanine--tRNA ligase subunit beta [Legionella londiniensis]|uniref:Phenylalanine--tRNA ligase beta subunit n=1 Tax=Legionella londiniensis TaxID=45068 RepID=A0A0W0VHT8_9GAMM|nr:phenylalanine--tRNA ligase subunit beta [Legionella londiniensis]KTD19688.1 phenylalanyl-tRNA synthetase subunit beta [Legionella londiniensis]STX92402.1 Phenylalanyl-tRNA synthetase beta subunit [Legionella londiniensis]
MKVSEAWLREWVNPSVSGEELASQLTMIGLEVDARNPVAGEFIGVVVAEVVKTSAHPQADKLTVCEVKAAKNTCYQVVCGAANVRSGLKVALALPGAALPNGLTIKETKLRGELSQGMLCSAAELGLEESSEGILELADDAPVGKDLREYLALNDSVLDIALTPNRADCFSIAGIAREIAARNKMPFCVPGIPSLQPEIDESLPINIEAKEGCPQYFGRIIQDINPNAETPFWMKERLRRSGIRCLHPVVDAVNYVMLELGQPMHAFDTHALAGAIQVRHSKPCETLLLLNGEEITLQEKTLVIADEQKPLAIAGVMGGEESAVQANTRNIFIESAFFNPMMVAGVARRYGLCTDSSQRFERGVDPGLQLRALERVSELIQNIAGGSIGPVVKACYPEYLPKPKTISFNPLKVRKLSGLDIDDGEMLSILERLGMLVVQQDACWEVAVPSFRFDLQYEVDLVEEIIRLYGYDNIAADSIKGRIKAGSINAHELIAKQAGAFFSSRGYREIISYGFVDPQLQTALYPQADELTLLNPISQELSVMRVGMWPGLLAAMIYNFHRQHTEIRFFECGVTFSKQGQQVHERASIAGLLAGEHGALNWSEATRQFDFYDMKGDLQALFTAFQIQNVEFTAANHPALHPGKCARILIGGEPAGWLGVLHPRLLDALELTQEVVLFELDLQYLLEKPEIRYTPISKYPRIRRDLSFLVKEEIVARDIEGVVRRVIPQPLLKSFDVFDLYKGPNIPAGKKSMAIALTLQDERRTLVDAEINAIIDAIINKLKEEFAITLRD